MDIYRKYPESQEVKISKSGDTAIHVAIANGSEFAAGDIVLFAGSNALAIGNERGNTPLHLAALHGRPYICQCIAEKDSKLIGARNDDGETPLFLAATHGKTHAFLCLQYFCKEEGYEYAYYRRKNGDTILHSAISEDHFGIACYIIHQYPKLVYMVNEDGISPLHLLASKPSTFHSGTHLIGLRKLVYDRIHVSNLAQISDIEKEFLEDVRRAVGYWKKFHDHPQLQDEEAANEQDEEAANEQSTQPRFETIELGDGMIFEAEDHLRITCTYYLRRCLSYAAELIFKAKYHLRTCTYYLCTCLFCPVELIFKLMMNVFKLVRFIIGHEHFVRLRHVKERCKWSVEVMNELLRQSSNYPYELLGMCPSETPTDEYQHLADISPIATTKMETTLLMAAKHGVVEMVEGILRDYSVAIFDVNTEKKNIVMLAAEHRQLHLYEFLLREPTLIMKTIFGNVDKDGNSVLHIAAKLGDDQRPWLIRGAALQMHMEVKWYKFVERSMPPRFFARYNRCGQTAEEIFRDTHRDLIKEGRQWLTNNSQSCSLVAALIATVAFATSATFPGGFKQESGMPVLENEPIFMISAVSSFIALCSSMISVVMFLGILTSNFQSEDFHKDLPRKLLLGLISLLVSIVSMLISFFGGHHFVLKQKLKHALLPVYTLLCLPLLVFIIAKLPLDFEIVRTTLKKKPQQFGN